MKLDARLGGKPEKMNARDQKEVGHCRNLEEKKGLEEHRIGCRNGKQQKAGEGFHKIEKNCGVLTGKKRNEAR